MIRKHDIALKYIRKMYQRICKKKPIIIEHQGKVKYILMEVWCCNINNSRKPSDYTNLNILCKIVKKATNKFPESASYISEHLNENLPFHRKSTPNLCWMGGYFSRVQDHPEQEYKEITVQPADFGLSLGELLDKSDSESEEFLAAKLETLIDEAQDILDSLSDEEDEDEDDDDEE